MATLKCKYCGGNVEQFPGNALGICSSCGAKMTLPQSEDDQRAAAHNCGNFLRRTGNFEKALAVYQKLLQEDPADAEASWCSALCRYGITYEKSADGTYRPVTNQKRNADFMQDGDYLAALSNSDGAVRLQYESEAVKISKLFKKPAQQPKVKQAPAPNIDELIKQAFLLLNEQNWTQADAVFDQCLAINPRHATSWLGKLLAELKCRRPKDLAEYNRPFDDSENYKKALQYSDDKLKKTLLTCSAKVRKRSASLDTLDDYRKACAAMNQASTSEQYNRAAAMFQKLAGYRDADEKAAECLKNAQIAQKDGYYLAAVAAETTARTAPDYRRALELFQQVPGWRDADLRAEECQALLEELEAIEANPKKKHNWFKIILICLSILLVLAGGIYLLFTQYIIPENKYKAADALLQANNREQAISEFQSLGSYKDSADRALQIQQEWYADAEGMLERMEFARAAAAFGGLGDYEDARERSLDLWNSVAVRQQLSAGGWYTAALKADGTAVAVGDNREKQGQLDDWEDLVSIDAGWGHTIGLKSDGTVVRAGYNGDGRGAVEDWKDIVSISVGQWHTVGLQKNGQVIGTGCDNDGRIDFSLWKEIRAISAGRNHTVGLKADGTVVAVGNNDDGQCNVADWHNISAIAAGGAHTVGLKNDGTVVAVGNNDERKCLVKDWEDIVAIAAGYYHTVGLKADGTVVAVGWEQDGQCNVSKWTDIVAIAAGGWHTVGLKSDGTVVATGRNVHEQCEVSEWTDMMLPPARIAAETDLEEE